MKKTVPLRLADIAADLADREKAAALRYADLHATDRRIEQLDATARALAIAADAMRQHTLDVLRGKTATSTPSAEKSKLPEHVSREQKMRWRTAMEKAKRSGGKVVRGGGLGGRLW